MKKSILFFAIATLTLVSCKKETIEPTPEPTPTPMATSASHLFCVDAANNYAHLEVYLSGNLVSDIQLTTESSAQSSVDYYGSVYLYNDSTYVLKVRNNSPGAPYFFEKTVTASPNSLTWGSGYGTNTFFSNSGRWQLKP